MEQETIQLVKHPSEKVIRRCQDYVVDGLGKITVMTAEDAELAKACGEPLSLYQAFAVIGVRTANGQVAQFPVEFLVQGASDLKDAFTKFQEQAATELRKNIGEAQKRMESEQQRIITAPAGAVPNLQIAR